MVQMDTETTMHDGSWDTLPILMEALVEIILGQGPICIWVFTTNITDEFISQLDIMHAHNASMDFRHHMLQLGDKEVPLRHPGAQLRSTPCMNGNSKVAVARCDRIVVAWLEGSIGVVDSLTGTGSRATNQAEVRTLVQPSARVPWDHWLQKRTKGRVPTKEPWCLRWVALRMEQFGNSSARTNPWGMEAVCHQERKQMCQGYHDIKVSFMRIFTDFTGTSSQRRNGDIPVGYSGQATLWRK